jgi:hypothetical protein
MRRPLSVAEHTSRIVFPNCDSELTGSGHGARRRALHVFVKPAKHLVNKLFVRLHSGIPVRLVREYHQPSSAAVASNRFVELVRLYRRSTRSRQC